jgi:hypothetical protein
MALEKSASEPLFLKEFSMFSALCYYVFQRSIGDGAFSFMKKHLKDLDKAEPVWAAMFNW